jgi:hypothetical protein
MHFIPIQYLKTLLNLNYFHKQTHRNKEIDTKICLHGCLTNILLTASVISSHLLTSILLKIMNSCDEMPRSVIGCY